MSGSQPPEIEVPAPGPGEPVPPAATSGEPPQSEDAGPAEEAGEAAEDDPYVGRMVADRYRVISRIGEGGMGAVYLAEHVFIEKKMALKVLHGEYAHKADLVARFLHEAKAASKIDHPNVVQITDFGQTETGNVFFAMEYLKGEDLAQHLRTDGAWKWKRAKGVFIQICRALQAAHAKGIIHRDMKPENILLVEKDGQQDFVKVLDFGIAKMSGLEQTNGQRLTRTGMIFGTPEYMSPEQARGDKPDHRVDVYAVGCIMYEMLTGSVPFLADTFMGVLTKHMFDPVVPPRKAAPTADVPAAVEAIILQALEKNRDKRFASMNEMSEALEAVPIEITQPVRRARTPARGVPATVEPRPRTSTADDLRFPSELDASAVGEDDFDDAPLDEKSHKSLYIGAGVAGAALLLVIGLVAIAHGGHHGPATKAQGAAGAADHALAHDPAGGASPAGHPAAAAHAQRPAAAPGCTVTVTSTPPGASLYEDGRLLGPAPYAYQAACGTPGVRMVAKLRGFRDTEVTVAADTPGGKTVDVALQAYAPPPVHAHAVAAVPHEHHHEAAPPHHEAHHARPPSDTLTAPKDLHNPFD